MKRSNFRITRTKESLKSILKDPEMRDVKNRYRALGRALVRTYPDITSKLSATELLTLIEDTIALDRDLRALTEDYQREIKEKLSQEWQLRNGYEVGYHQDIKRHI